MKIGIAGTGRMGAALAQRLLGLGNARDGLEPHARENRRAWRRPARR